MEKEHLYIRDAVIAVSKKLNISPRQVTYFKLIKYSKATPYPVIHNQIKQVGGGLTYIKKRYFPETQKDLEFIDQAKETSSYITKLEKKVGELESFSSLINQNIRRFYKPIEKIRCEIPKKPKRAVGREIVCMLNDVHYGLIVNRDEVGGVNEYNWKVAARRTAYFIQEVCNYKRSKRGETNKVHLVINGDLIQGVIHGLKSRNVDLLTFQMNGSVHILTYVVTALLKNFEQVEVHFNVGNHGDMPHRREGGKRVISQVYDNFESGVFYALSAVFRDNPRVLFNINKTVYNSIDLPAGRCVFTHGHIMFANSLGNPGSKVDTKSLSNDIANFNRSEISQGKRPAKLFLVGHTHTHLFHTCTDGTQLYNVPCMSGVDDYAFGQLGIRYNLIAQLVFESTQDHILGDSRLIHLNAADKDTNLDKIIPPYEMELKWEHHNV